MTGTPETAARQWTARMISPLSDGGVGTAAPYIRGVFTADKGAAELVISSLGLYRAYLNGKRVGESYLTPGWTCYDDRIAFHRHDISDLLVAGENVLDIWLGDGWYRSPLMWRDLMTENTWGARLGAIAEVVAGGKVIAATGPDWKSGLTSVTKTGIYYGEDQDARAGGAADKSTEVLDFDMGLLVAQECGPVVALGPIAPVDQWTDEDGRTLYDFGQNVGGVVRIGVDGAAGASVLVEHAEVLGPGKVFDNRNYRAARAAGSYILKGGAESFEPVFTFMGFRYARVTIKGEARVTSIASVPLTSVPVQAGGIETGEKLVDRLVLNTIWSQRGNFIEVPTDCPQRDERLGWSGDAQVFAGTACWLADSQGILSKYLRDLRHDQRENGAIAHFSPDPTLKNPNVPPERMSGSTGWGDAIAVIPWQLYLHYGDEGVLRECWPAIGKWLDYLWNISDGPVIRPSGEWGGRGFTFGDWLQPIGDNRKPRPTIGDDCAATLYHFITSDLAAKIGAVIGEHEGAARAKARAEEIRRAFLHEFMSPSGRLGHNDQTSYALAFLYGLIPDEQAEAAKGHFRRAVVDAGYHIGTGFIGTPALLPALTRLGMGDLAQKVFLNRDVPGWLYQVEQGATTIWERWDAIGRDGTIYEPSMNSYNHYAYGAVCQWLFEDVAGIAPMAEAPGFDRVSVDPAVLPALGHMKMWHDCRHGRIEAGWSLEGEHVRYKVSLPAGCEGQLTASDARRNVTVNGSAIGNEGCTLPSGAHEINFRIETGA